MNSSRIDETDRQIINALQGGFPLCERPYAAAASGIGIDESELIARLQRLVDDGILSRFGPMYDAEKMGGAVSLCAIAVPDRRFEDVAGRINKYRQVAHNYARAHQLNMWFVLACDDPSELDRTIREIESETDLHVHNFPKQSEYFIGLKVDA